MIRAPALSPAAALVRRFDPDLFYAALFAPRHARERLMVLYAFDIELSRAAGRASEHLIAQMRLQWWRDVIAGIEVGEPPRQHDIAGPLHGLLTQQPLPGDDLAKLADARELELDGNFDERQLAAWLDGRFAALTRLAANLLVGEDPATRRAASAVGQAMGTAFALRSAVALATEANQFLLPGLAPEDRAALALGRTTVHVRAAAQRLAEGALAPLAAARDARQSVPRAATPALLPVWRAEKVLARALQPGFDLQRDLAQEGPGGRGLALAWRALRGRW
jgi:phytoene synthase